jgi:predicted DNA-binding transcriptional regulator YafY
MTFTDKKTKLDYLLELIQAGNAGNAQVLSKSICVSERTLSRFIEELRSEGYQISYSTLRKSYYLIDNK